MKFRPGAPSFAATLGAAEAIFLIQLLNSRTRTTGLMVRDDAAHLLTMRFEMLALALILRSPPGAGVSKDGPHQQRSHTSTFSRRTSPEFGKNRVPQNRGRREDRMPCAPAAPRAKSRKHADQSPQVRRSNPAFPARLVLTASFALSLVIGFLATIPGATRKRCRRVNASVEASRPRDFAVR
jgi:hypothetical protein